MTDVVIFLFGLLVTLMTSGAIGLLLYGARQDGAIDREMRSRGSHPPADIQPGRRTA